MLSAKGKKRQKSEKEKKGEGETLLFRTALTLSQQTTTCWHVVVQLSLTSISTITEQDKLPYSHQAPSSVMPFPERSSRRREHHPPAPGRTERFGVGTAEQAPDRSTGGSVNRSAPFPRTNARDNACAETSVSCVCERPRASRWHEGCPSAPASAIAPASQILVCDDNDRVRQEQQDRR